MKPEEIQQKLYDFPYHYLPTVSEAGIWGVARYLDWGYEYLGILEAIKGIIVRRRPIRVLDFGCGDGRLTKELISSGVSEVIGVEISERALLFAKAIFHGMDSVHLFSSVDDIDPCLLPVDVVVAMEVLEHIPPAQVKQVVKQLRGVMSAEGVLVVSVPTTNRPVQGKHYQHFSLDVLMNQMGGLFSLVECRFVHKLGLLSDVIRRMVVNRFVTVNNETWLRLAGLAYKRFIMKADPKTGAHMICAFVPK